MFFYFSCNWLRIFEIAGEPLDYHLKRFFFSNMPFTFEFMFFLE